MLHVQNVSLHSNALRRHSPSSTTLLLGLEYSNRLLLGFVNILRLIPVDEGKKCFIKANMLNFHRFYT